MSDLVQMSIAKLELDMTHSRPLLVLEELHGERRLPIFIDYDYVELLNEGLQSGEPEPGGMIRTWLEALPALGGRLLRVEITEETDEGYQSDIVLRRYDQSLTRIASPVGFALAAALYSGIGVFARSAVLDAPRERDYEPDEVDEFFDENADRLMDRFKRSNISKYKM